MNIEIFGLNGGYKRWTVEMCIDTNGDMNNILILILNLETGDLASKWICLLLIEE